MNIDVYQRTHARTSGSTDCVGWPISVLEISNLEMVDQSQSIGRGQARGQFANARVALVNRHATQISCEHFSVRR
jgi:hypothetical protein